MRKKIGITIIILLIIGAIFYFGGKMHIYTELPGKTVTHEFVSYIDEMTYSGQVEISTADLPETCRQYLGDAATQTVNLEIAAGKTARLAMFVDFVYCEFVHQTKNMLTGRLLDSSTTYYYKPQGKVVILPVYSDMLVEETFDHQLIKMPEDGSDENKKISH